LCASLKLNIVVDQVGIHFHALMIVVCLVATATIEGKMSKPLKKLLRKIGAEAHEQLAVADAKLGSAIKVSGLIYKL